ncbi:(2Fe-2S)-binding protein [Falsiroseomonas oryzae]|uniref:(2Fe-2S)-binding protein n=1 Tax=Falsiroseomonas oryzae TaxID=2766473 RepID=UPI0022EB9091|nr:(2Fe-2S)-binding protein [Roseomonas sp. MO-31]
MHISLQVNGTPHRLEVRGAETLAEVLRDRLGLTGTKIGCNAGECGACTVVLDGRAVCACLVPTPRMDGAAVRTIEGVTPAEGLSPLQQALVEHGAFQCGFCTPGVVMSLTALFDRVRLPSEHEIRVALQGNVCRCSGYVRLIEAAKAAALRLAR